MTKKAPGQHRLDGSVEAVIHARQSVPSVLGPVAPVKRREGTGAAYRLLGPPGCGKTTALATRWIPAAVEKYGREAVVVCSLTKAAAHAIVSKGLSIPPNNVGTLHSFALRSIGRPPVAQDRKHLDDWNKTCSGLHRLTPTASNMDGLSSETAGGEKGDELLAQLEIYRHQLIDEDMWPDPIILFNRAWTAWKQKNEYVDFTDMMELALGTDHCPGMPAVLIIDEAQDCSKLEIKLVKHWGAACESYVLAGDADQSIYEFRGANADAFMNADVPESNVYTLNQSYRVPAAIQKYAGRWIRKIEQRHDVEYKPKDEVGECRMASYSMSYAVPLVREAEKDAAEGREVMLLATCAYMLKSVIATMRKRGVAFHNPYRKKDGRWNPMRGGGARLFDFLSPMRSVLSEDKIGPRFWTWLEIHRWLDPLSVKDNAEEFQHGCKVTVRARAEADKLCLSVTKGELKEVFTPTGLGILKRALATDADALDWYRRRLLASKRKMFDYAFNVVRRRGLQALTEEPKIIVGTIHSVKGGGTNCVYLLPDLPEQAAQDYARGKRHEEIIEGDRYGEQARRKRYAIIRQFYVGMTRATDKLVLLRRGDRRAVQWLPIAGETE